MWTKEDLCRHFGWTAAEVETAIAIGVLPNARTIFVIGGVGATRLQWERTHVLERATLLRKLLRLPTVGNADRAA
jgi:hypothetical protein